MTTEPEPIPPTYEELEYEVRRLENHIEGMVLNSRCDEYTIDALRKEIKDFYVENEALKERIKELQENLYKAVLKSALKFIKIMDWIKVEDKLPEAESMECLCFTEDDGPKFFSWENNEEYPPGFYYEDPWADHEYVAMEGVTHWMEYRNPERVE